MIRTYSRGRRTSEIRAGLLGLDESYGCLYWNHQQPKLQSHPDAEKSTRSPKDSLRESSDRFLTE